MSRLFRFVQVLPPLLRGEEPYIHSNHGKQAEYSDIPDIHRKKLHRFRKACKEHIPDGHGLRRLEEFTVYIGVFSIRTIFFRTLGIAAVPLLQLLKVPQHFFRSILLRQAEYR